ANLAAVREERRVSPQEKKIRSYQRDGRNAYGEATGASRRGVRRRKQLVNKANRRATSPGAREADSETTEESVSAVRPKRWKRSPQGHRTCGKACGTGSGLPAKPGQCGLVSCYAALPGASGDRRLLARFSVRSAILTRQASLL